MNDPNDQRKDNYQHRDTNRHSQLKNDEQRNDDVLDLFNCSKNLHFTVPFLMEKHLKDSFQFALLISSFL